MPVRIPKIRRQYHPIFTPIQGLRNDLPSTVIPGQASPKCLDVEFERGYVRKTRGARAFAGTDDTPLGGTVMGLVYENSVLFAFTTTKTYQLVAGTFTDKTVTAQTGDEDNPFSHVLMYDSSHAITLIWTNGVQKIQKYDFTTVANLIGSTAYITKWLNELGDRLCLYNVTDTGVEYPLRVRWSTKGDPEDMTSTGAGAQDLDTYFDSSDAIQRAEKLSGLIAIYGQYGVILQEYRAEATNPFAFIGRLNGVGLAAPRALANIEGTRHIFMGFNDIYDYRGGREVVSIGKSIRDELFNRISPKYINRSFMVHRPEFESIRLYIPVDTDTTPSVCYQYNLRDGTWSLLNAPYTAFGRYIVVNAPTWDSYSDSSLDANGLAVDAWDNNASRWNDRELIDEQPYTLYGDSSGVVYQDDNSDFNRAQVAIDGWWDTKDFTSGDEYTRTTTDWMELNFEALGDEVSIYYSLNSGKSYTLLEAVTLDPNNWDRYRIDFSINAPQLRFRFRNSTVGETFQVRWFEIGLIPCSDRAAG